MLAVLSPAKKLDMTPIEGLTKTHPELWAQSAELLKTVRRLSRSRIQTLMGLSDSLADLNHQRFKSFEDTDQPASGKQAMFAFSGDTFVGLNATDFSAEDVVWAQEHLRILSGLYGLLRPLDVIQPYRLEMGTRLKTRRGATLYEFWGTKILEEISTASAKASPNAQPVIINLASKEYARSFDHKGLAHKEFALRVITPIFQEEAGGKRRTLGFVGKRMRGAMARFMIQNRLTQPEGLFGFAEDGMAYDAEASTPDAPVFVR